MKYKISLLIMLMFLFFIQQAYAAKWTFMVYIDGDNNLEEAGLEDFLEMAQVGSNSEVNILVQMDRAGYSTDYGGWETTKRFKVTKDMTPTAENALQDLGEANMGSPTTLQEFIQWGVTNYPADNYALVLWNHGGGWRASDIEKLKKVTRAVCWDDTNSDDCLFMSEVKQAITTAGTHLSLVGFDACLMGMVEVDYALSTLCDVVVGSEEVEPWEGWPYNTILTDLIATPTMTAADLGTTIVQKYGIYYGSDSSCTQAAFDMSKLSDLVTKIDTLADSMNWASGDTQWAKVNIARSNCMGYYYDSTYFIDLYRFADQVKQNVTDVTVQNNAENVKTAITSAIISNFYGSFRNDASGYGSHGRAIYFPQTQSDYTSDSDYPGYEESNNTYPVDYVKDHSWDNFIRRFYERLQSSLPSDTYEDNDTFANAYGPLTSANTYESYIYDSTDVDYYKINVTATGVVNIDLWSLPDDYDLYLYDSSQNYLADSMNGGTTAESISYSVSSTGTYYIKVVGWSGAYSNTDSYLLKATLPTAIVDSTPPTGIPSTPVDGGSYSSSDDITFTWTQGTASDTESGIVGYYLQVSTDVSFATFKFNADVGNILSKGITDCSQGLTYYARVKAKNGVGLYSEWSNISDGIKIDITPPILGLIRDGTGEDIDLSNSTTTLSANWDAATDNESTIAKYYYAIGTKPGSRDIVDWADNGATTCVTKTGLSLQKTTTYYFTIRAENSAGVKTANYYQDEQISNSYLGEGLDQNWNDDDESWLYNLPFEFNFYGTNYSSVYIDSNGYLDFTSSVSNCNNSQLFLKERVMIAPLWDALSTLGSAQAQEDIYIHQPDTSSVCIRWCGQTETGYAVNFEVVLYESGKIMFNYGSGNTNLTPTIGISKGDKYNYLIISGYDAKNSLTNAGSIEITSTSSNGQAPFRSPGGKPSTPSTGGTYSNSKNITFSWTQGTVEDTICDYYLQVSTKTSFAPCVFDGVVGNVLTKEITNCLEGKTYYARVRAKNNIDLYTDWSDTSNGITIDTLVPTSSITLSRLPPLKTGTVIVYLDITEANPILQTPVLQCLLPQASSPVNIELIGEDKSWLGTLFIDSIIQDGTASFSCAVIDAAGNTGTTITSGVNFEIDKTIKATEGGTISNSDGTQVVITANVLPANTNISITVPSLGADIIKEAIDAACNDRNVKIINTENTLRTFSATSDTTGETVTNLNGQITITLPYQDLDQNGIVDGTNIKETTLRIFYLDENSIKWTLIKNSQLNTTNNTVSCQVDHFSTFCLMGYTEQYLNNLDKTFCYPNPCRPKQGETVKIVNLPVAMNTKVYIYNIAGELVRTLLENEEIEIGAVTEIATWDGKNEEGEFVASGIYIYVIETNTNTKCGKKIAILK